MVTSASFISYPAFGCIPNSISFAVISPAFSDVIPANWDL
jgi:hypothetical protein